MKIIFICFLFCVTSSQCTEATQFDHLGNILQSICIRASNGSYAYRWDSPIGPDCWPLTHPRCGGRFQSPININTLQVDRIRTAKEVICTKWIDKPEIINVRNTGKTIELRFEYQNGEQPVLFPTPITNDMYQFDSAHLHFIGSEHSFNFCEKYSMEAHLIFFNLKYVTREYAANFKDGLIVVAKFYKLQYGVDPDFTFIRRVEEVDTQVRLTDNRVFSLEELFGPIAFNFYTYFGSLTTPDCREVVTFLLDDTPLKISVRSLKILSHIRGAEGYMSPNIRPIQPTNGRKIYYYCKR